MTIIMIIMIMIIIIVIAMFIILSIHIVDSDRREHDEVWIFVNRDDRLRGSRRFSKIYGWFSNLLFFV